MTRVKICGLTSLQDALVCLEAGAELLGFIFYPPSPRGVTPVQAGPIAAALRESGLPCQLVGVFVDEPLDYVRRTASRCHLDYVQLHGSEPPGDVAALMADGIAVIKAFRARGGVSPEEMARYPASAHLLDAYVAGQPGGTGQTCDWQLAAGAAKRLRLLLAGGLTPGNVAQAVRTVHPWGVDVASGVEGAPGRKDGDAVRRFVAAVRRIDGGDSP